MSEVKGQKDGFQTIAEGCYLASPASSSGLCAENYTPSINKKVISNYSTSNSSASSFLTHQTTNPTSTSSTNLNYGASTVFGKSPLCVPEESSDSGVVKKLRKTKAQYKRLESELSKFTSKSPVAKSTHLRLTLLHYLRSQRVEIYSQIPSKYCVKTALTGCKAFLAWWSAILSCLTDTKKPVPASQKSAYYECISRFLSRSEWKFVIQPPKEGADNLSSKIQDCASRFTQILTDTLDYSINQLTNRNSLSLSLSAFIGKVFATSFFYLDGVSNALLFLLNVRNVALASNYQIFFSNEANSSRLAQLCDDCDGIKSRFPQSVRHMVSMDNLTYSMNIHPKRKLPASQRLNIAKANFSSSFNSLTSQESEPRPGSSSSSLLPPPPVSANHRTPPVTQSSTFSSPARSVQSIRRPPKNPNYNAIQPPRGPVAGITDPRGSWVKKWASSNSDVFNSFLRHYLSFISEILVSDHLTNSTSPSNIELMNFVNNEHLNDVNCLIGAPGFMLIWSRVADMVTNVIRSSASRAGKRGMPGNTSNGSIKSNGSTSWSQRYNASATAGFGGKNMTLNFFNLSALSGVSSSNDARKNSPLYAVAKIFTTLRDFLYNPKSAGEKIIANLIICNFDNILINYAKGIAAYDFVQAGLILDLVQEFIIQVCSHNASSSSAIDDDFGIGFESFENDWYHVYNTNNIRLKSLHFAKSINWKFWLSAVQNMLLTENINSQLKALAFLFNVWEFIPDNSDKSSAGSSSPNSFQSHNPNSFFTENLNVKHDWFKNPNYSPKYNFSCWLISPKNWLKFFCHWLPLVRSYYLRLIVWRLLSGTSAINSFENTGFPGVSDDSSNTLGHPQYSSSSLNGLYFSATKGNKGNRSVSNRLLDQNQNNVHVNKEKIRKLVTDRLSFSYEKIIKISQYSSTGYYLMPDMNGSSPIVNRKFSITPLNFLVTNENLFIDPSVNHINDTYNNVIGNDETETGSSEISKSSGKFEGGSEVDLFNGLVPIFGNSSSKQVRKINPFEIFDDAVYSSTAYSLMMSESNAEDDEFNNLSSSNTVVDSGEIRGKIESGDISGTPSPRRSLTRGLSLKSTKSKSFTSLSRSNSYVKKNETFNDSSDANDSGGGKLFGFAFKMFKKSKSSTNVINEGYTRGRTFVDNSGDVPALPKKINLFDFVDKEDEVLKSKRISLPSQYSNSTNTNIFDEVESNTSLSTDAESLAKLKNAKKDSSLNSLKGPMIDYKSTTDSRSHSFKIKSTFNGVGQDSPRTEDQSSVASYEDYDEDFDDDDDDDSSSFGSRKILRSKASMKSLKNLTNSSKKKRNGTLSSTSLKSMSSSHNGSHTEKSKSSTGLDSLPLPPEFQQVVPEVPRQVLKFSLVLSDENFKYQMFVVNNSSFMKFHNPTAYTNININNKFPHYPSLPFSESMGIGYLPTDEEYTHNTEFDTEYNESEDGNMDDDSFVIENIFDNENESVQDIVSTSRKLSNVLESEAAKISSMSNVRGRKMSISSYFTCNSRLTPDIPQNSFFEESPSTVVNNFTGVSEVLPRRRVAAPKRKQEKDVSAPESERDRAFDLLKKWGSVGKALNEWNDVVQEFEDYVKMRRNSIITKRQMGVIGTEVDESHDYSTCVPLLIAEAPAPKINAS